MVRQEASLWDRIKNYYWDQALLSTTANAEYKLLLFNYNTYRKTYKFLKKSQWWSREQLEKYQLEQLNILLNHAYENVPYYTKVFDKEDIKPSDIHSFEDFQKIPFLTKDLVKKNINELKAKNYPDHKFGYMTTGGTTGIPMEMYEEKGVSFVKEMAFMKIVNRRVKCDYIKDKFIILRGDIIPSADQGKFWASTMFGRCLVLSSYHLSHENLPKYVEVIRKFKPKFISAYPSSITILARFMKTNNLEPFPSLKVIMCGAENLYDWQRTLLEDYFKCRVFEGYGHSEQAVHAAPCEYSNYFHIFPEYGITEIIDKNGKPVKKEDEKGEIVGTGFKNHLFPFIRYKTGDFGVYTAKKCTCGRNYPLLKKIEGRWLQEFIITKNNRPISITALNMHSNIFDNVKQFQLYQDKKSEVILKIVKSDKYTEKDSENLMKEFNKKLGDDIDLKIKFVNEIPRTPRGKYNFIDQKLPIGVENL